MDSAGHILLEAHHLYARNSTSTDATKASRPASYKAVGIILAVCSGLFIGVSFVVKKVGLLKANEKYNEVAGEGYGYLKNAWWWAGMSTMIVGEICNFVAYAFVDAILVTPFGALSVVITTILSAIFLKERLSFVGKVGCFQCVIGAVVIAINAPEQSAAATIQEMQAYVIAPGFLSYAGVVIIGALFTAFWVGPRWGKKSMFVYISICSFVGGLSVVATQGLGAAIVAQISGTDTNQFKQWFLYVLLVFVIATLLTEIIYLNKALNLFNAALVTPTYYVMFTSATIITSAILFRGFHGTAASITTVIMGFLFICSGVVLLQLAKSSKDVPDTAIFQGDLDQMRTIAEQEEPESEPRADTIRGGAAIVRAISKKRTMRQLDEVKTIHSDHMQSIGEDEPYHFDGIRRRKTVLAPGQQGPQRTKTIHPPLGMSHFPGEDDLHSDAGSDGDVHPGFHFAIPRFGTFNSGRRRKSSASKTNRSTTTFNSAGQTEMKDLEAGDKIDAAVITAEHGGGSGGGRHPTEHVYGLPPGLQRPHHQTHGGDGTHGFDQDTSYKSPSSSSSAQSPHVYFAEPAEMEIDDTPRGKTHQRTTSGTSILQPPPPPPHALSSSSSPAKRTFSFQNPFSRLVGGGHGHHGNRLGSNNTTTTKTRMRACSSPDSDVDDDDDDDFDDSSSLSSDRRPLSRSAFSYTNPRGGNKGRQESYTRTQSSHHSEGVGAAAGGVGAETEEERLGLVKGDSSSSSPPHPLGNAKSPLSRGGESAYESLGGAGTTFLGEEEDEWLVTGHGGSGSGSGSGRGAGGDGNGGGRDGGSSSSAGFRSDSQSPVDVGRDFGMGRAQHAERGWRRGGD